MPLPSRHTCHSISRAAAAQQLRKIRAAGIHRIQYLLLFSLRRTPAEHLHHPQQQRRLLSHATHTGQLLHRGRQYAPQRPKLLQQPVGQLIGVPPGDGIIQQHLQQLMVRQAPFAVFQQLFLHSRPVSLMYAVHGARPLLCRIFFARV